MEGKFKKRLQSSSQTSAMELSAPKSRPVSKIPTKSKTAREMKESERRGEVAFFYM